MTRSIACVVDPESSIDQFTWRIDAEFHERLAVIGVIHLLAAAVNQDFGARALISVGIALGDVGVLDGGEDQASAAAYMLDLYRPPQLSCPVAAEKFDADRVIARRHAFFHRRFDSERLPLTACQNDCRLLG